MEDLTTAETEIINFNQGQQLHEEISMLERGSNVKRSSQLAKLGPVIQDGVISKLYSKEVSIKMRLDNAKLCWH